MQQLQKSKLKVSKDYCNCFKCLYSFHSCLTLFLNSWNCLQVRAEAFRKFLHACLSHAPPLCRSRGSKNLSCDLKLATWMSAQMHFQVNGKIESCLCCPNFWPRGANSWVKISCWLILVAIHSETNWNHSTVLNCCLLRDTTERTESG